MTVASASKQPIAFIECMAAKYAAKLARCSPLTAVERI